MLILGKPVAKLSPAATTTAEILTGLAFLMYLRWAFTVQWTYDDKGITIPWKTFHPNESSFHAWSEIENVSIPAYLSSGCFLSDKKGVFVQEISYHWTRNYSKVLADVVRKVQKNNPNARIDSAVLKKISNGTDVF